MFAFKKKAKKYFGFGVIITAVFLIGANNVFSQIKTQTIKQYANKLVEKCKANPNWKVCYSRELEVINKKITFKDTLDVMDQIKTQDGKAKFCHILAHNVVASEVQKDPQNWAQLLKFLKDPYSCSTGFIHGLVEAENKYNPQVKFDEKGIELLCQKIFEATNTGYYYPCAHAAGHVLLVETGAKIDPAAEICNKLPRHMQDPCLEGIFMEYINRPNLTFHGLKNGPLKKDEFTEKGMINLCNSYKGKTAVGCWKALALVLNETKKHDIFKIKETCKLSNSDDASRECYFRSFDYALNEDDFDTRQIPGLCNEYENTSQEFKCYENAIISLLYKKDRNIKLVKMICETAPLAFQKQCNSIEEKYFGKINDEKKVTDSMSQIDALTQ